MPRTQVVFFKDDDGTVPFLDWLDELDDKAKDKCVVKIERLAEQGHELRRPEADLLRDGIYELRTKRGHVQYRILYFFHGNVAAVVSHGLTKEDAVPGRDIDKAVERKNRFLSDPMRHTLEERR
ncbi:MAG: type II toxin-antitoxin system RelE/ParE family toxin [Planctomycetota bacterium]|nr:type II toxin-antitoxin system RelE/ParE family toxin [Planctomycetota bacterium]